MTTGNSNLERISMFSYPSNHLLNIQLMRDLEKTQTNKPEYFFFVNLAPGSQDDGARTYDMKSTISIKYAIHEIASLCFSLKQYANGNGKHINYIKFAKSSTGQKSVLLEEASKQIQTKSGEILQRNILFKFVSNNVVKSISLTLDQTYGLAEMLEILYKKAADLEFSRSINAVSFQKPVTQQPQHQTQPNSFMMGEDDNSSYLGRNESAFMGFDNNPFG